MSQPNGIPTFNSQNDNNTTGGHLLVPDNRLDEDVLQNDSIPQFVIFQIPPGVDVIEWVKNYAESRKMSVTILGGCGFIREVVMDHTRFESSPTLVSEDLAITTFSGSFLFSGESTKSFFSGLFAKKDGSLFGGMVSRMISSGPVVLNASMFKNAGEI